MSEQKESAYVSRSQQTLIKVVEALGQLPLQGLSLTTLMGQIKDGASRDQIYRALKNLEVAGWVEQVGDVWRLTPAMTQVAERVRVAIADLHHRYLAGG